MLNFFGFVIWRLLKLGFYCYIEVGGRILYLDIGWYKQ